MFPKFYLANGGNPESELTGRLYHRPAIICHSELLPLSDAVKESADFQVLSWPRAASMRLEVIGLLSPPQNVFSRFLSIYHQLGGRSVLL